MYNITKDLDACGYDYMPVAIADGETDNTRILQNRIDAGLPMLSGSERGKILLSGTIHVGSNTIVNGKAKG